MKVKLSIGKLESRSWTCKNRIDWQVFLQYYDVDDDIIRVMTKKARCFSDMFIIFMCKAC